ncbi:uncharacterized protein C12orf56 homolog isoform X7 [Leopardus geoffroyi]|uniref:uncharacterized protein C12orf56 homolog isoform X7 n=1 Tax=Leopardus geoffroyi TaxID=46844 RepID=UPI001E25E3B9|nr:uncharacterized protein C12orf56 homolog isoform X7 [Leopardus geoffroyi]
MGGRRGRGRGGCSREPGPGVAPRSWGPRALRPGEVAAAGRAALWRARVPPQAARRRGPAQASANPPLSAGPRPPHMAGSARAGFPAHTNSRLDAFLRRRLPPEVYDAIRAYEPCIVVSDSEKHTFKYVVLSDRLIYLTENPPKSIRRAVALRDVVAIDLIDDYPQFLSPPDRETNQHIRIIYSSNVLKKECEKSKGVKKFSFPFHPSHFHFIAASNNKKVEEEINGPVFWRGKEPRSLNESSLRYHQEVSTPSTDSTFCLPSDLKEPSLHGQSAFRPLPTPSRRSCQSTSAMGKKATLLQDPLRAGELSPIGSQKPYRSEEKIKHFGQLKSELFLKDNTLRKILCLITELKVAAQKNFILKRLFWKTSDLFYFLVNKLHEYLPESRDKSTLQNRSQRADELVACIEIMQTLGLMFRETETESSRLKTLAAKKGALFNLLVILISEPQIPKSCPVFDIQLVADSTLVEMSFDAELQNLIKEYTDTATALLYEIFLVFQQGNLGLGPEEFAISWMMSFLQSRPPFITFLASIVKQVVKGLGASFQPLSPSQAVLLYQQFYILKSCLQYSQTLAEYIRNDYREEFSCHQHHPTKHPRLLHYHPSKTTRLLVSNLEVEMGEGGQNGVYECPELLDEGLLPKDSQSKEAEKILGINASNTSNWTNDGQWVD